MNTQRLILDLDKSSVPRGRVTIAQCDHDGTTVEAEIYDNGIALDTSGLSAYLVMRLPDGRHYYRVPATLDGHVATALVDEAYAATATGTTEIAYFELVGSGDVVYSTSRFGVRVLPSATADATVPETWDGEVEQLIQQLDDAIETATDAANEANAAAANADATADGVESRVQEMAQDAAETATADAEQRIQDAIDAMGDISELAVPLMSKDVRGGAKLEEHGGLVLRDEKLGIGSLVQESDGAVRGGIAGLTAKGHAEQDGNPTPDNPVPIQMVTGHTVTGKTGRFVDLVAQGKNLLDESTLCHLNTTNSNTLATNSVIISYIARVNRNTQYVFSCAGGANRAGVVGTISYPAVGVSYIDLTGTVRTIDSNSFTFTTGAQQDYVLLKVGVSTTIVKPQLELGSTATEYEPYFHTTTPIPLPSRGWVGSLPDGTADVLTLDGAGKVEWERKTSEKVIDGSISWRAGDSYELDGATYYVFFQNLFTDRRVESVRSEDYALSSHWRVTRIDNQARAVGESLGFNTAQYSSYCYFQTSVATTAEDFQTWLSTHPVTVLYPLATPVTEDCGYVEDWPTDIPEGAVISIPELDAVNIEYFIDSTVTELARQWYARAQSEYESRILALEQAVAELATA